MTRRKAKAPAPATIPLDDQHRAFVHDLEVEQRDQRRRHPTTGALVTVQTYRVRCACGWATTWNDDRRQSWKLAANHGRSGQLSIVLP